MVMTAVEEAMVAVYGSGVSVNATWSFTDGQYPTMDVQSVRLAAPHPIYAGRNTSVSLVMRGDSHSTVAPIELDTRVTVPVVVMKESVAPGTVVQTKDVEISTISVAMAPSNAIRDYALIVGKRARSRLLKGRIATAPMLQDPNRVLAGQPVAVVLESSAVWIKTNGTLRSAGSVGDNVVVEFESKKGDLEMEMGE